MARLGQDMEKTINMLIWTAGSLVEGISKLTYLKSAGR